MTRQLGSLFTLGLLFGSAITLHAATPQAEFSGHGITVRNITPGADVVFVGVARSSVPELHVRRISHWQTVLPDAAYSGTVTFDLGKPVPPDSVWVIADVTDGHYVIARPGEAGERLTLLRPGAIVRDGAGADVFVFSQRAFDLLYVHPGHGAWAWSDVTRTPDSAAQSQGLAAASMTNAKLIAGIGHPSNFAPGGVLIAIDNGSLDVQASRVTVSGDLQ